MSDRGKLAVGVGVSALALVVIALMAWPRGEGSTDPPDAPAAIEAPPRSDDRGARPSPAPAERPIAPIAAVPVSPASGEARDHTGEPLSAGPAQLAELPERPEGALDNTPTPEQREASLTSVLDRLDAEIAAAKAAGDTDEVARLEVRKARLERKR